MADEFDVIVIGSGPPGENAAGRAVDNGFTADADWNAALNIRAQANRKLASGLVNVEAKAGLRNCGRVEPESPAL